MAGEVLLRVHLLAKPKAVVIQPSQLLLLRSKTMTKTTTQRMRIKYGKTSQMTNRTRLRSSSQQPQQV